MLFVLFSNSFSSVAIDVPLNGFLKGKAQFAQEVTSEPLMDFKQNHYGRWKYYKTLYFQMFFSPN